MHSAKAAATSAWDRHVATLTSKVVTGGAILPIEAEMLQRKSAIYAQKGVSMRAQEATALVEAIMDGKVHRDYVIVGGLQYLLTTVSESGFYGTATSVSTGGGIVLVKNRKVLVLAVYAEPVTAAEAIPYVHQFADNLEATF
jgi:hypothetical protein